jgi:EAL and modified HD-GYP domain-containing signal transduction protein
MANSTDVFMARQPIYDSAQKVAAYELLFRSGEVNSAGNVGAAESAKAVINSLIDIGLGELSGDRRAFINVDQELLMSGALTMLPRDRVTLEILETVQPTPEAIEAVKQLRAQGYVLALDDFELTPTSEPFIQYADIIKFDLMAAGPNLARQARRFSSQRIALLAEKLETAQEFKNCTALGFEYFQGYYFAKPEIIKGNSIPPDKVAAVRLAAKLQDPNISVDELEQIIAADLSLTYRLLKLVSSAHVGLSGKVASVRHAIMFLGMKTVASVATLLAMSASSKKPDELVAAGFLRAKMCELLASVKGEPRRDRFFTVGLMSIIDAILDAPMEELLAQLPLEPEMNEALLNPDADSSMARILQTVIQFEKGDFDNLDRAQTPEEKVNAAYRQAISWSTEIRNAIEAPAAAA